MNIDQQVSLMETLARGAEPLAMTYHTILLYTIYYIVYIYYLYIVYCMLQIAHHILCMVYCTLYMIYYI